MAATTARLNDAALGQVDDLRRLVRAVAAGSVLAEREPEINRAIGRSMITGNPRRRPRDARLFRDPESDAAHIPRSGNRRITVGGWTGPTRATRARCSGRGREVSVAAKHEAPGRSASKPSRSRDACRRISAPASSAWSTRSGARPGFRTTSSRPTSCRADRHRSIPTVSKSSVLYVIGVVDADRESNARKARRAFRTARAKGSR